MKTSRAEYRDLGLIDYGQAWELQRSLFDGLLARKSGGGDVESDEAGYVLLCEHEPVYTLGKSGHKENLLFTEGLLRQIGATFYHIDRGGDVTFHGPGQIVGYPIVRSEEHTSELQSQR